jgi:high affinity Mn2+ porin
MQQLLTRQDILRALLCASTLFAVPLARADDGSVQPAASDSGWQFSGQATYVDQYHPAFNAPYSGANSLNPASSNNETADITLFAGHRLWNGAEFWINPEIDQGYGLSNTLGIAGFPSGEAYKIGANAPYLRIPRAFVRQVFNTGGEMQAVDAAPNQLAENTTADNLTLTVGKFSVVDIFDTNTYAHDPRGDFLNWAVIDGGAFDYAADSWGFTNGIVLEWNTGDWTLRGGLFQMSDVPNAKIAGYHFHDFMSVAELEQRHKWLGHPGKIKLLVYADRASMGTYTDALALAQANGATPNTALVRQYRTDPGFVVNVEQEVAQYVGVFARASAHNGSYEAYEFSDIDRSLSAGVSLQGALWGRAADKAGVAVAVNAISSSAQQYFADGGMGILIGDGKLDYAREQIAEVYYAFKVMDKVTLTADCQRVDNPAYNQDRGPVNVYALRLHAEF